MTSLTSIKYIVPKSVEELLAVIGSEENPRIVAGNTLLNELGKRNLLGGVTALIDINELPLDYVKLGEDSITLGSLVTFTRLLREDFINRPAYSALKEALSAVHPIQVRNAATIGGCIGAGLPFLDVPPALLCLDAVIQITTCDGTQTNEYSKLASDIAGGIPAGQLITKIQLPKYNDRTRSAYSRFSLTGMGESVASVAIRLTLDGSLAHSHCTQACVAIGGAGIDTQRISEAETFLTNSGHTTTDVLQHTSDLVAKEAHIVPDLNGSAEFKRKILSVQTKRTLSKLLAADSRGAKL
ncbi:MAG TPA: FAD binding domain-containing protein [Nitrososphaerales archaeon]|nr:FAD binding domain-containing protein [Nitrososphaerales archaeon]